MVEINSPELLDIKDNDLSLLREEIKLPPQRAAYSDRTAWLMSVMADMAYQPFEKHDDEALMTIAEELASMNQNPESIKDKLLEVSSILARGDSLVEEHMRVVLASGGFELVGTFFSPGFSFRKALASSWNDLERLKNSLHDTQGFLVARKEKKYGDPMAILVFRGTTNIADWITNANVVLRQAHESEHRMHPGFKQAYKSVEDQIHKLLSKVDGLPLYITGHSLGGALAICATCFLSKHKLAACYTFGGPRVGSQEFVDQFKTPIYRIVNGFDPVPLIPPSKTTLFYINFLLSKIPVVGGFFSKLLSSFPYAHAGDQRYLTDAIAIGENGDVWQKLKLQRNVGFLKRIANVDGEILLRIKDMISYHSMPTYRKKLRYLAKKANPAGHQKLGAASNSNGK